MPKGRPSHACGLCTSPKRAKFEAALRGGASLRAVAREYGISHCTLHRHMKHAAQTEKAAKPGKVEPPQTLEMPPAPAGDGPIHRALRELGETHAKTLERYQEAGIRETAALHLQLRRDLELRARLEAEIAPDGRPAGERLWDNPDFRTTALAILDWATEDAERRRALLDVLARVEAGE